MEITREEPAPATGRTSPEPTPGPSRPDTSVSLPVYPEVPEDLPPRAVTLQDVRDYLAAAGEDERTTIRADLMPDMHEAGYQARLIPARRSFSTQTPAPSFTMSQNPDESVTLEHSSIHFPNLDTLTQQD